MTAQNKLILNYFKEKHEAKQTKATSPKRLQKRSNINRF